MFFSSPWIRKPDFPANGQFDYNAYWETRGWKIAKGLKPREQLIYSAIPAGARVIDIGCGNSRLPVALKEKGVAITVADVAPKVLEGYKTFGISGHQIDLTAIEQHTLTETYDYIIMSEVLEHVANPEEVILILKQYTRQFVITVPNSAAYLFRFGLMFKGRFFTQWVMHPSEHVRYWSHLDFMDWLTAMGITVTTVSVTDGFTFRGLLPWLPNLWKNFLGFRMMYVCEVKSKGQNANSKNAD
ncbi:MAG: class I SAM-dependent methyltransferase [Candidatus Pacebacteria bacterium]|nr:class I SAM-dependent methyltransferase [Candidatus Paceibacterota bacterium]